VKKFTFCVVKQHFNLQESGDYTTYGISSNTDSQQLSLVSDVSCDLAFVNALAAKCTRLQLDPMHLQDVILDSLN